MLNQYDIQLDILRLDNIHQQVNGNKWFKLKQNLAVASNGDYDCLLSFGGAYSNHIRALAAASALAGLRSIGVIRGELPSPLNPVLQFARDQGMLLHPISRSSYRQKQTGEFITGLHRQFGEFYLIPEGGSNELGVQGCEEIIDLLLPELRAAGNGKPVYIATACGTGATLAGLIRGAIKRQLDVRLLGIAVLKGAGFLREEVASWLGNVEGDGAKVRWNIELDYHFGGYARSTRELQQFIESFVLSSGIPIEPVYTGKLFFGLYDLIQKGTIPSGSRVVVLHTGGVLDI